MSDPSLVIEQKDRREPALGDHRVEEFLHLCRRQIGLQRGERAQPPFETGDQLLEIARQADRLFTRLLALLFENGGHAIGQQGETDRPENSHRRDHEKQYQRGAQSPFAARG